MADGKFRSDWQFTIYLNTHIQYRKSLGRARPDHNSKIALKISNGKHISTRSFRLEILDVLSKTAHLFKKFSLGRPSHLYSDENVRNSRFNGKQPKFKEIGITKSSV